MICLQQLTFTIKLKWIATMNMDVYEAKKELELSQKEFLISAKRRVKAEENFDIERKKIIDHLIELDRD